MGIPSLPPDRSDAIARTLPDITEASQTLSKLTPEVLSMPGGDYESWLPVACVCFDEAATALGQACYALAEASASLVYYREFATPPSAMAATYYGQFYTEDAAVRLYSFGEHMATGIQFALDIPDEALAVFRERRGSHQAAVGRYLEKNFPADPFTAAALQLKDSDAWMKTVTYRNRVVHEQPPTLQEFGIAYRRERRWKGSSAGGWTLPISGGDEPEYAIDDLVVRTKEAAHAASAALTNTVQHYLTILAKRGIVVSESGCGVPLFPSNRRPPFGRPARDSMPVDAFGFIPRRLAFMAAGYVVRPVADFDRIVKEEQSRAGSDGFLRPISGFKSHYRHRRSATAPTLFGMQATHEIVQAEEPALDPRTLRLGQRGVLIHGLAFLMGVRAQFSDWWFDGAAPTVTDEISPIADDDLGQVLDRMIKTWQTFPPLTQSRFVSILYVENRNQTYPWYWEQFMFRYTAFDAIYRCLIDIDAVPPAKAHGQRFKALADSGLLHWSPEEEKIVEAFVRVRNELVHEAMLEGGAPGSDAGEVLQLAFHLKRLNERLVLRLSNVRCGFVDSPWNRLDTFSLDLQ